MVFVLGKSQWKEASNRETLCILSCLFFFWKFYPGCLLNLKVNGLFKGLRSVILLPPSPIFSLQMTSSFFAGPMWLKLGKLSIAWRNFARGQAKALARRNLDAFFSKNVQGSLKAAIKSKLNMKELDRESKSLGNKLFPSNRRK